jgi:hypothetical protein
LGGEDQIGSRKFRALKTPGFVGYPPSISHPDLLPLREKVAAKPPDEGSLRLQPPHPAAPSCAADLVIDPSPDGPPDRHPLPQGERESGVGVLLPLREKEVG